MLQFKKYVSAKIVKAAEMDEVTFLKNYRNELVKEGMKTRPGYLVIYPDDYTSWSPKQTFDNSHREVTVGEMDLLNSDPII